MSDTLPGLLEELAERRPRAVAMRKKQLGIWRELTWREVADEVTAIALALDEHEVRGASVAILAENEPSWLLADLGIQTAGGRSVGLYPSDTADEVAAAIVSCGARIVFCGDQEQVDKVLELPTDALDLVVVFDTKGLHTPEYAGAPIEPHADFCARGRARAEREPDRHRALLGRLTPEDIATVALTSGTSGSPRGAMLGHRGEVALARMVSESLGFTPGDSSFSLLPLAHATARLFDAYTGLVSGKAVNFPETPETTAEDMTELAPTCIVATPRLLERVRGDAELRIARAARFKRLAWRVGMRLMRRSLEARLSGRSRVGAAVGGALGRQLVGRFVLEKVGLANLRYGGIGSSFVAPELLEWFWAFRLPVFELYGQVETGGIVTTQRGESDRGTAGAPIGDAIEVRVDAHGELMVRSPGLLSAYLDSRDSEATEDGWYRTGDVAVIDEACRVQPIGRRADVVSTSLGEEVPLVEVESALKLSPFVSSAMAIAAGCPWVGAVIEVRQDTVIDWARRHGIPFTTYASLTAEEAVVQLIGQEVERANERLPETRQVRAFRILPQQLDEELTPTGKLRRGVIAERYAALIAEMYADVEARV